MKNIGAMRIASFTIYVFLITYLICGSGTARSQTLGWTQKANYGGGETYDPFAFVI